ncbi:tryptophan synthase beta subunit-like PLP-dependent enzyme [Meredithblackwellia eburnea MCA 4105]
MSELKLSEPTSLRWYSNPEARHWRAPSTLQTSNGLANAPTAFHRSFPNYSPTPLVSLPALATELGVSKVYLKDESSRLGLPSFKILGASWAIAQVLSRRIGLSLEGLTLDKLRNSVKEYIQEHQDLCLIAATDGNHGRGVAHMARLVGLKCSIFVPSNVSPISRNYIASEGAEVTVHEGDYDEAVARAFETSEQDRQHCLFIQDTAWDGYEEIPKMIVEGYTTLFSEVDDYLTQNQERPPSLVVVPVGVGSLAHSAVLHHRSASLKSPPPSLLSVEPTNAPCVLTSFVAGRSVTIRTRDTVMPGLCCGTPSSLGWSDLQSGFDAAVSVTDDHAVRALEKLKGLGSSVGPCGAATLAGVEQALGLGGNDSVLTEERRRSMGMDKESVVVLICTEGPEVYNGLSK